LITGERVAEIGLANDALEGAQVLEKAFKTKGITREVE